VDIVAEGGPVAIIAEGWPVAIIAEGGPVAIVAEGWPVVVVAIGCGAMVAIRGRLADEGIAVCGSVSASRFLASAVLLTGSRWDGCVRAECVEPPVIGRDVGAECVEVASARVADMEVAMVVEVAMNGCVKVVAWGACRFVVDGRFVGDG
jgi:hypothetical protein